MSGHMLFITGSLILASGQLLATWLVARKNPAGWLVSIGSSLTGFAYDVITGQYGFLIVGCLSIVNAVSAYRNWGKKENGTSVKAREQQNRAGFRPVLDKRPADPEQGTSD